MKYGKLLTPIIFFAAANVALGNQDSGVFTGATKLQGYCIHTQNNQTQKSMEFVLVQDPRGGVESKSAMVAGANRITVEYASNSTPTGPVQYYHTRFLLHSFKGDLAVLDNSKRYDYLFQERELGATFQTKNGVQIECVAEVLNVK
jgi:hypothetical protein